MGWLTVVEPGMLTTVQDLGRPGHTSLGVPVGGAADPLALRAGNRLVGNSDGAAGLECTLTGPTLLFEQDAAVALTGAANPIGEPAWWARVSMRAGERLRVGPVSGGARAYVTVAGGLCVPPVLGSASTLLSAGFGGHLGRALKAGDRLEFVDAPVRSRGTRMVEDLHRQYIRQAGLRILRAVDGPHSQAFDRTATDAFWSATFKISNHSNRTGVRLDGPVFSTLIQGDMASEGMPPGAVQITPNGQPIVLGPDHPTTGGYPVIACVATVDAHLLGQARPGETLRFERVTVQQARAALIDREREWNEQP